MSESTTPTPEPMTDERLAEIRERAQAATKGPWTVEEPFRLKDGTMRHGIASTSQEEDIAALDVCATAWPFQHAEVERDAAFIAHAREDVPALLAEVERLRSELDDQRTLYQTAKAIAEQATKWHTDARAELAETTHVLALTGEKLETVRRQRDRLTPHAVRLRHAWDSARQRARGYRQAGEWVVAERDRLAEQVKRVREVAAYFRDREAHLKERYEQAANDAQATALLSSAALTGDAAHRIECALDGTEASS